MSPLRRGPLEVLMGSGPSTIRPVFAALDIAARVMSPYDLPAHGESAPPDPARQRRLRAAHRRADQALRHGDQRAHRPRPRVPQCRADAGRPARVGVPAHDVPGRGDRRRPVLGWRLLRQSVDGAAGARVLGLGHHPGADQSDRAARHAAHRARDPQPPERDRVQRHAAEGTARRRDAAQAPSTPARAKAGSGPRCACTGSRAT